MNPWRSCECHPTPRPAHVAVPGGMAVKGRFGFDSLMGGYANCLLALGFSALQLLTACLPALGQLPSEMARTVVCMDLQCGSGWLQELLLLCN